MWVKRSEQRLRDVLDARVSMISIEIVRARENIKDVDIAKPRRPQRIYGHLRGSDVGSWRQESKPG